MAAKGSPTPSVHRQSNRKRRRGVHAKTKHSNNKTSRFYVKKNRGQGVR